MKTNKTFTLIALVPALAILFFVLIGFIIRDPQPDLQTEDFINRMVPLADIETTNRDEGVFIGMVNFSREAGLNPPKEFYGQVISIEGNGQIDKILVGITSNLISRIELWRLGELVASKELGFVGKMTWGEQQTLRVVFYDQRNPRYPGTSKVTLQFYDQKGFFGDIGTASLDLTGYGDMSGEKSLGVFARSLSGGDVSVSPTFSNLRIWKNYHSFD